MIKKVTWFKEFRKKEGGSIRLLLNTPLNDVEGDVLTTLDPLIPIRKTIYFGGWEAQTNICAQMMDEGVQPGEILLLIKGGGDPLGPGFQNINTKFTIVIVKFEVKEFNCWYF